jgi:flagellar biosynthesis GTPase FlhF
MTVSRTEIERALDEIISNEEGVRFQRLATRLAQQRWPDLIASEPKKDLGADAKSSGALSAKGEGKVLACSITAKLEKIKSDAKQIKTHFTDVKVLVFATPRKMSNETAKRWSEQIRQVFGYEFILISREEIVNQLMEERNFIICQTLLHIPVDIEADLKLLVSKTLRATSTMTAEWFAHRRLAQQPLINLRTVRLDEGNETRITLTSQEILDDLLDGERIIVEGPAGRGKTTTLSGARFGARRIWPIDSVSVQSIS